MRGEEGCKSQCLISQDDDQRIASIDYVKLRHNTSPHRGQSNVTVEGDRGETECGILIIPAFIQPLSRAVLP